VRIGDDLYWDGGVCSNTPIDVVVDDDPPMDTLCIMVDLWNRVGPEPRSIAEVQTRQKDILYATRSRHTLRDYRRMQDIRRAFCALSEKLPPELQETGEMETLTRLLSGPRLTIIRLKYPGQDWSMPSKDINFSRGSIKWRWEQGYADALRAVEQEGWLSLPPSTGAVIYELPPQKAETPQEASPNAAVGKGEAAKPTEIGRSPRRGRKPRS
jgi:NTE family protein